MKRNPLLPFALIALLGIGIMFIISFQGLSKADELAKEASGEKKEEVASNKPEDIYKQSCLSCHGDQLQGVVGPALAQIGGKLSEDDIKNVIANGQGTMPGGLVDAEKAGILAKWLAEKK